MKKSSFHCAECVHVSSEMFKFNGQVTSALNHYFIKQNAPLFLTVTLLFQQTPTASYDDKHNARNTRPHVSHFLVFLSRMFGRRTRFFIFIFETIQFLVKYTSNALFSVRCWQPHSFISVAFSKHCFHVLQMLHVANCSVGIQLQSVLSLHSW